MSVILSPVSRGVNRLRIILEMIKFEHTIFALPFALIGAIYASNGLPNWRTLVWIIAAMVGARSAAMSFNRLADHKIDAKNPRTSNRALPAGTLKPFHVAIFLSASIALFELASYKLNMLCLILSPVALIIVLGYSYSKRFTSFSHLWLGLSLGIAPTAAWIAVSGRLELQPVLLSLGVMLWTAGFDVLYSLQDLEFDKQQGLFSIPKRFGLKASLWIARGFHLIAAISFAAAGIVLGAGIFYFIGVAVIALLLIYEHTLVNPQDLTKINIAFFTVNGYVSVVMLLFVVADWVFRVKVLGDR
ncbi:MAG: UbiA-like polyprenyltransferase [bacterium]